MMFDADGIEALRAAYPGAPARLRHGLAGHPLFSLERLAALAAALPPDCVEYNPGDAGIDQDPSQTPMNGLSPEETVRRIEENNSWMALKNIERDPACARFLNDCLDALGAVVQPATGPMHRREGFVFVSSPGAVTPFHMDPEHNILLQLQGEKTFRIFPPDAAEIVSDERHEQYYAEHGHRNLPYKEAFADLAIAHRMAPGDALYVPVKAPHWVEVGPAVSVSLSITWRSRASDAEARLRRANAWLRARGGAPPPPGAAPLRDKAVIFGQRLAERLRRG